MAAAAKVLVVLSALIGAGIQAWLGSREWPSLLPLTAAAFAATFILVRVWPVWGWAPLLITAYIYPVIFWAGREFFTFSYYAIFLGGLMGGIIAAARPWRWHLPLPWRLALACWALMLALVWPVLAARELNFMPASYADYTLANSGLGGPPPVIIITMLVAVLPQMAGILWLDAMFAAFAGDRPARFRRAILLPLAAGLALSCALAVYQWTADITFLSSHQWPYYNRAAGGLMDGNASGQLYGLWSAAALTWGLVGGWMHILAGFFIAALTWLGVWGTGSRMALLAALVGIAAVAYSALRDRRRRIAAWKLFAGIGGLIAVAAVLAAVARFETDPVTRVINDLPEPNRAAIEKFIDFQFWNRFGPFGTASVRMFKHSPAVGVGPGTFEPLYVDYAYVVTNGATRSHFDNAQSWYRHQLVELGLLGSIGWVAWLAIFARFVWRVAPARDGLTEATGVRAAIIALAVISIISMPARNVFVSLSFWVFAFWLALLAPPIDGPRWLARAAERRAAWAALLALALAFAGLTGWTGYRQLRPPHRAVMANWDYLNGVSRPLTTAEGVVRYTRERGVAVFPAGGPYLKLTYRVAHPDAASAPVTVRVFEGDDQVGLFAVADRNWRELYVGQPEPGTGRLMLTLSVDRPARDAEARGLVIKDWEFVDRPPPGSIIGVRRDDP